MNFDITLVMLVN